MAVFSPVCPPSVGSRASGRSFAMIFVDGLEGDRLDVRRDPQIPGRS